MSVQFETFDLPAHWASAFLYGDHSGLEDEDVAQLEAFEARISAETGLAVCVAVDIPDGGDFRRYHDAPEYPWACDVAKFTFDLGVRS